MLRPTPAISRLSSWVVAHPKTLLAGWAVLLAVAAGSSFFRGYRSPEPQDQLGSDQPAERADALARHAFPDLYDTTDAVLVFARDPSPSPAPAAAPNASTRQPLTPADLAAIRSAVACLTGAADAIGAPGPPAWVVHSHFTEPILASRLVAKTADGRPTAVMVMASYHIPADSDASLNRLSRIESAARVGLGQGGDHFEVPAGLRMEVTGDAGLARDQRIAQAHIFRQVTRFAVLAVLAVLLLVYRAPLAACIPLLCIAASAYVATQALELARSHGAPIGANELTYLVVIVFGAGTDFALFWLSRYDEELTAGLPPADRPLAARRAYAATMPGILSSAAATILGLSALIVSQFVPPHALGLSMAFALFVALLAAMTLMPPLAMLMGRALFWPRRTPLAAAVSAESHPADAHARSHTYPRSRWAPIAAVVTRRPATVALLLLLALAGPLARAWPVTYQFETDPRVLPDSSFARGLSLATTHFGGAMLSPWTCLIQFDSDAALRHYVERPPAPAPATPATKPSDNGGLFGFLLGDNHPTLESRLDEVSTLAANALAAGGASDVWHYAAPLGRNTPVSSTFANLIAPQALRYYWNPAYRCLRLEVMAAADPFSPAAVAQFESSFTAVKKALASAGVPATASATGRTPFLANTEALSTSDEWRIKSAVAAVVAVVVFLLLRDVLLTAALVLITLLAYQATLGLSAFLFVNVLGHPALNWEVKMYAFVILMAVGQDYNLFLISRLAEERRRRPLREAVRQATVRTGGIISSCGLITAASLAALCTSGQYFLQQMGFTLACGVLMDTFLVRPLLLPALLVLLRRPRRG